MMGLGYLGYGGSSASSSNLSALAPPFTVDRSNPKPNSNPLMHFTEPAYAGGPFHSSFHNWQYSHPSASRPDFYSNIDSEVDSIGTPSLPSAHDYRYLGSHSLSSPSAHMPPLNPSVSAATDTFNFVPYSSGIPSTHVEAKSYYPSFVSSVVDDDIPLVALNEPSYDLLTTSRVAPLDGASQVDYTQSLSGLEYTTQWGPIWNRLADEEQGKQVELNGSFCLEEANDAASYVYKRYMKQGVCTAEGPSKLEEASAVSHTKCVDVLGRESQSVSPSLGKLNDKSSSLQDPRFISGKSSRTSISGMGSTLLQSHTQVPSLESATKIWNHQNPYSASYDKCFQSLDSSMNDHISVKKSSPALVIRPPSIGTGSTLPNRILSEDVKSIGNVAAINSKDFGCFYPSNEKEPLWSLSYGKEGCLDTSRPSLHLERGDHGFVMSSSTTKEDLSKTKDGLDHMSKAGMEFQLPIVNVPDGFTLTPDSAIGFTSVEDSLESLDHYNPAVDSPCWKGAPASPFYPSETSEAITPQHLKKKLEGCNSFNLQQTQMFPPCTDDTVKVSCQNLCENSIYQGNGYVELGSLLCFEKLTNANCPTTEHDSADAAVKAGFDYLKPSRSNGVKFSNDIDRPRKEYDVPTDPKSDSDLKPSHTKRLGLDKGEFISEREFKLCADVEVNGLNTINASEDGSVPFHGLENTSCSPYSAEDVNKLAKLHETESTPKVNVQTLVDTIHNLSELLLFHCSNDASAVLEQDHEALKHAINNLDACVSKNIVNMSPTQELMFIRQGTSHECRNLTDLHKGVIAARPPVTKEAGASSHGWFDPHCIREEKRNDNVSGKEVEKFPDFVSLRGDADIVKDDNIVQAIKEVLKEDLSGEEEMQSETLLYKNLWLEAEAALCTISYRARLNRMKIEMEKCNSHKAKDVAESTKAVEKLLNAKISADPNITHKVTPEAEDSPISDNSIEDSLISSTTKVVDDVETSVLARLQILQCRGENSNSVSAKGQRLNSEISADPNTTHKVTPEAKDSPTSGNLIQDSFFYSTTKEADDVEASVLARFQILKCRGENSNSISTEGQRLAEVVDTGFAGKRNHWPFIGDRSEDGSLDVAVGPYSQYCSNNSKVDDFGSYIGGFDHETLKEFRVCGATDDQVIQSCGNNRLLGSQLPSGSCDSSSSDWEHVQKDEFACQN